jgi:beta-lactamase regulating signal transducer with metallopeptidase domain
MNLPMNFDAIVSLAAHQIVQISLVILIVGIIAQLFLQRRPRRAYALWMLALAKCLLPPVWSSATGLFSWMETRNPAQSIVKSDETPSPVSSITHDSPMVTQNIAVDLDSSAIPATSKQPRNPITAAEILAAVWITGSVLMAATIVIQSLRIRKTILRSSTSLPPEFSSAIESLRQSLSIHRAINIVVCEKPIGPALFGLFAPILVIPRALLESKTRSQLRPILAHEMIHLRRRDPLVTAIQLLCQCVWWFSPLTWWMNWQINRVRELCCDGEVIAALNCEPADYAQMLLDVARLRGILRSIIPSLGVRPVQVTERRIDLIMSDAARINGRSPKIAWAMLAIIGLLILPGAGLSQQQQQQQQQPAAAISPATEPSSKAVTGHVMHYVRLVVGMNRMTFEGQDVTLDHLPDLLKQVPDRANTIFEIANESDQMTISQLNDARFTATMISEPFGFKYSSYIGVKPIASKGSPDKIVADNNEHPTAFAAKYNFYIYGEFDLGQAGKPNDSNADKIKEMVRARGGKVENAIDADTDFVVLGSEPTINQYTPQQLSLPFFVRQEHDEKQAQAAYLDARDYAMKLKIPIMNQNRFLKFCGYQTLEERARAATQTESP